MNDEPLSEEELKIIREIVKREQAAGLIWKWVTSFLYVAVPIATLYAFYKSMGGNP